VKNGSRETHRDENKFHFFSIRSTIRPAYPSRINKKEIKLKEKILLAALESREQEARKFQKIPTTGEEVARPGPKEQPIKNCYKKIKIKIVV
jgi:hypothetical protein